jgi:hypothetical protein
MPYATFSHEALVQNGLRDLNCSINFICAISERAPSPSLISLWLNGSKRLDNSVTAPLVETLSQLKEIADSVRPLPLQFRDVNLWREILQNRSEFSSGQIALAASDVSHGDVERIKE